MVRRETIGDQQTRLVSNAEKKNKKLIRVEREREREDWEGGVKRVGQLYIGSIRINGCAAFAEQIGVHCVEEKSLLVFPKEYHHHPLPTPRVV